MCPPSVTLPLVLWAETRERYRWRIPAGVVWPVPPYFGRGPISPVRDARIAQGEGCERAVHGPRLMEGEEEVFLRRRFFC